MTMRVTKQSGLPGEASKKSGLPGEASMRTPLTGSSSRSNCRRAAQEARRALFPAIDWPGCSTPDLAPAASITCERSASMLDKIHGAGRGEAHALPVAPARAPLRQQRHLQVDGPRRARTQTMGPARAVRGDANAFFWLK